MLRWSQDRRKADEGQTSVISGFCDTKFLVQRESGITSVTMLLGRQQFVGKHSKETTQVHAYRQPFNNINLKIRN